MKMEPENKKIKEDNSKIGLKIPLKEKLTLVLIFVLVISLGFLAVNQGLGFFYKAEFLKTPCELCKDLNPEVRTCFKTILHPDIFYGFNITSEPTHTNISLVEKV